MVAPPRAPDLSYKLYFAAREAGSMGRLVSGGRLVALRAGGADEAARQTEEGGDGYLQRVAKYVPAEVVGFFLFVNNILQAADGPDHKGLMIGMPVHYIAVVVLIIGLILTPVYIWYVREEGDAWVLNAAVSTAAFPVWAYAMGAVALDTVHDGNFASILLATFTVCSGLLKPRAKPEG
jgi:hypothetical protein